MVWGGIVNIVKLPANPQFRPCFGVWRHREHVELFRQRRQTFRRRCQTFLPIADRDHSVGRYNRYVEHLAGILGNIK